MLLIKGLQKLSLVDFPEKTVATIFVGKCNFRCPFCHNRDLVLEYDTLPTIEEDEIFSYLNSKKKWIDGVCITGGEPLLHKEVVSFIEKIKKIGLLVKLDTNGTNPKMLKKLIEQKLVDYVAMDIKSSLVKYDNLAGVKVNKESIKRSVEILMEGDVDYEFRTTVAREIISKKDIEDIGKWLKGAKRFSIQNFKPNDKLIDKSFKDKKPFFREELEEFKSVLKEHIKDVSIKGA